MSGIHKVPFLGRYLPLSIVGVLISVKNYLRLACVYPVLPLALGMLRFTLEGYLSSWTSAKNMGIPTCEENITFYGVSESWPVFRIEITGILIKHGFLQLFSLASVGGSGVTPAHLYFQSSWLGAELIWRLITCCLVGRCMKGIKTVWTCGPGYKLYTRVQINWIPSGVSTGIKLGRLSLIPVVRFTTT